MPTQFRRVREPIFNLPIVVLASVGLMVVIHAIRMALPEEWDDLLLGLFAFAPDRYFGLPEAGAPWPGGLPAQIWSPFTYALLHNDLLHLISNCTVFAAIGNVLARRMTANRFLLFCVVTAPLSAIGELIIAAYQSAPVIGASGVICAMMGALARILFPPAESDTDGPDLAEAFDDRMITATRVEAERDRQRVEPRSPSHSCLRRHEHHPCSRRPCFGRRRRRGGLDGARCGLRCRFFAVSLF